MTHDPQPLAPLSRRRFLAASSLAVLAAPFGRGVEPFVRAGGPRLRLSLAAYSFREYFPESKGVKKEVPADRALAYAWMDVAAERLYHDFLVRREGYWRALDEAQRNGAELPVTALVEEVYAEIGRMGGGRWDTSSLVRRLR